MKKLKKYYWMLLIVLCAACNDPYETLLWSLIHSLLQLIYPAGRKTFPNGFTS